MYGTVTVLTARSATHRAAIVAGLQSLINEVAGAPELVAVHALDTDPAELVLVTLYRSEADAEALSERTRSHLGALVGPHVAGPPTRYAGTAIATSNNPGHHAS